MAYIGRNLEQFSNVEKLDNITFTNSVGPYNLLKSTVAFVPSSPQSLLIEVDGVMQSSDSYTINGSEITFGVSMASTSTMNSIIHLGVGLISTPGDATVNTAQLADSSVTNVKLAGSIANDKLLTLANAALTNSDITINGSAIALGGSVTIGETKPTVASLSPSVITNSATAVTITGTNFISVPQVEAINSTGAIVAADSITYSSATTIIATFTLPVDSTYFIRVENNDGNAGRSSTALLTVSDNPAWVTASGSLGSFAGASAIATQTLTCTDATSFAITSGAIATPLTFTTGVGSCTITGTQTQYSGAAVSNFTVTATDAEGQTADRAFSMSWTFAMTGSGQFN